MAIFPPYTRTLSKVLLPRSHQIIARSDVANPLLRVANTCSLPYRPADEHAGSNSTRYACTARRTYATAAGKAKPKAHTGRTPARAKAAGSEATTSTKKQAPRKKTVKKATKAKSKTKSKPKPKVKRPTSPTALKREAAKVNKELKETALLHKEPKRLRDNLYTVLSGELQEKNSGLGIVELAKLASQERKTISSSEHERLNRIAHENKVKNQAAYKAWVQSFTPLQIKEANAARTKLRTKAKAVGKKTKYIHITDDRLVKRPATAYAQFVKDRFASGDFKGITIAESSALIRKEWADLTSGDKKKYEDQSAATKNKYYEEFKTVYGVEPPKAKVKKTTTS